MGVSEFFVPPLEQKLRGRELKAWLQADIQRHWDAHKAGMSACECVQRIAASRQSVLRVLFEIAQADVGQELDLSLVALGGLGRGELAPYSDIDVVVLAKGHRSKVLPKIVDAFLYPLWDAGIDVGHAVRTPREFSLLAKSDKTVRTGALDCRLISGSEAIFGDLRKRLDKTLSGKRLQAEILASIGEWMEGSETSTVYRLEPNVKTGPGGLRTLHETWWAARVVWDIREWDEFLYGAKVSQHDFEILAAGREFMHSVRLALHVLGGRRQDVLRFDVQDQVAELLGISAEGETRQSGDILLERYYRQAKQLKAAATRIQERCFQALQEKLRRSLRKRVVKRVDGFTLWDGRLSLPSVEVFNSQPLELLRIFRVAQRHRVRVAPETRMTIAELVPKLFDETVAQSPEAVKIFGDILTDPRGGIACLEALHELGLLERLLPEFSNVVGLVQRDMYHVYTVDAHLIYCAQMILMALSNNPVDIPADIVEAVERVSRPHVLVLGALMHDIGKGHGHGHSARGAGMALEAARRMLWKREDRVDLGFLVQEHLSMMVISQRRDLEDLDLIHRFAARVETTERLDMLFVLSYADAVTTGPEAFTDWKAALLREIYQRTRGAIQGGAGMEAIAKRATARVEDLVERSGDQGERFRELASEFPHRHLVTHRFELLKRHFKALEEVKQKGVSVTVLHEEQGQGWEIVVACPDHAGLLSDLAGVLAANGVSVVGAYTGATLSGYAICTFVVGAGNWPDVQNSSKRIQLCEQLEERALQKGGDFTPQILARRRSARTFAAGVPISNTRILYDSGATGSSTVLDVFTPDRVGVLHLITRAIFEEGAMIEQARITTEGERAVDSFYVVDAITKKPLDERAREKLALGITRACTDALESLDGK